MSRKPSSGPVWLGETITVNTVTGCNAPFPVVLDADTTINATAATAGVSFGLAATVDSIDSMSNGYFGLAVNDPGKITFQGPVGQTAANTALGYLTTTGAGTILLPSTVDTQAQAGTNPATAAGPTTTTATKPSRTP